MSVTYVGVLLLSVAVLSVRAAFTLDGKCPDYAFTNGRKTSEISGDWYIIQYAENGFSLGDKICEVKTLKETPNGGLEATLGMIQGDLAHVMADPTTTPGKFEIKLGADKPVVHLSFLDSDSTNYAVVLLCASDGTKHGHFIEIVSRKKTLEPAFLEKAKAALATAKLTDKLTPNEPNC